MKFNKWTIGLAAVGAVSLASAARADETKMSQVQTALSSTTLSGYVDVGLQYGNTTAGATGIYGPTVGGADSISLNVVDITLDKPMDETPWATGYHVELWLGPGAAAAGFTPIRQAYIATRTPLGAGSIDWKIGVWDTIIGYEGLTSGNNPNYTHSYGFFMEPTTHTGILGTYKVNDNVTVQAGLADDSYVAGAYGSAINGVTGTPLLNPTIMGAVALTAPDSFGPLKGATLTVGGMNTGHAGGGATSLYAGATIPTPNAALKFGSSFDYIDGTVPAGVDSHAWDLAVYSTWQQPNSKWSLNLRGEYLYQNGPIVPIGGKEGEELTATLQYDLWANVLSRLEVRWDHAEHGTPFANTGSTGTPESNAFLVAAQLIYTF